jgi:hypothetical protein
VASATLVQRKSKPGTKIRSIELSTAAAQRMEAVREAALRRHQEAVRKQRDARREGQTIAPAKLEEVEDRLAASLVENHPRRDAALDRVADDATALSAAMDEYRRSPLLLRSTANLNQIEDLMLDAIVRTHPHRDRGLDRLLDDIAGDGPALPTDWTPAALGEHFVDNDYDGMA